MAETAETVVIGGGVVGACTAYLLAKQGNDVCILEQESVASGCTGHGHGVISLVGKDFKPGAHFALGLVSFHLYPEFVAGVEEDSGIDPLYHELDGLSFAVIEEEERIFRDFMAREDTRDHVDMRWIDVAEARELEPRLTEDAIGGVLYRHGQVDGHRLATAAATAAQLLGGRLVLGEATGLLVEGGRIRGVKTRGGEIACERVVVASGAWA
ncbi:MAG: FAD-dependent oxidoreductase, partial [Actinomycetia bacterium]|nr:FAD-dependent oxidoreductase [Actinomycetes bacterium]